MINFGTASQDQQSPFTGRIARVEPPTLAETFATAKDANDRVDGFAADFANQNDYVRSRVDAFTAKTGIDLPKLQYPDTPGAGPADFDNAYRDWLTTIRDKMQDEADDRSDPTLALGSDADIVRGGVGLARGAQRKLAELDMAPLGAGRILGKTAASGYGFVTDPYNAISLAAMALAPEGAPLLATALSQGGAMAGQQLVSDAARYSYRQQVNPDYGIGDVAGDAAGAFAGGALFGAGHALGGEGIKATLGAAAGGAVGGAALGGLQGGGPGALEGAVGGAALPLAGAGFGMTTKALGMSWRAFTARSPDLAASMPLEVRDAGTVAEKAGDLQAQNPWSGPAGDAAHAEAIGAAEDALVNGKPFVLPQAAADEASARRGQVFTAGAGEVLNEEDIPERGLAGGLSATSNEQIAAEKAFLASHPDMSIEEAQKAFDEHAADLPFTRNREGDDLLDEDIIAELDADESERRARGEKGHYLGGRNDRATSQTKASPVYYPSGAIDVRYGLAEHSDLVTSHDADFNVSPDYPADLQPRDRSSAPAQDQVNSIAANLEPDRLGPSPEANSGAPIVGPDGVVESGNGRTLAIGKAYDEGRAGPYQAWLERQGFDTTGYDKPVLVGLRETPLDDAGRAAFAHAANGSAALRMSATEQALSDARHLDSGIVDLAKTPDLSAAANRDFARAFVAKLPQGERGGMLTRDGGLSANGVRRAQAAMTARAYGDPGILSRALDHPDPNIKAIAGALTDASGPWARMRDAATRGDIEPGHDITRDMLQAVRAIMRARDEGRPAWEMLNQGDMFQSDTTQMAARMFFRDEEMRQAAGRGRVADALRGYAEEAMKNTTAGRLFDDAVTPGDVLRRAASVAAEKISGLLDQGAQDVLAMARRGGDDVEPRLRTEAADAESRESQPDLSLRNAKTGVEVHAQSASTLGETLKGFDLSRADPLLRASALAIGDRLSKIVGDTKVYTVGPDEMRALADGRMKVAPGYEPAGFYDPKAGHIVVLADAMRDPHDAAALIIHEGLHGALMDTINASEAARNVIDHLRTLATAAHLDRGGDAADHYGLSNAHEFMSEGLSNPEFQRFLASIPADDRIVQAFGLDKAPGNSLWDAFVGAVRKILGMMPDQQTLLDATLRLEQLLDARRAELARGEGEDLMPSLRLTSPEERAETEADRAAKAKAFADAKDAISYRINSDRIAQHPDGPRAGFLSILTNDPGERKASDRRNVEALSSYYQDKMAAMVGKMTEAYGSKWAGLKKDVAGFRDVISELFGVDTKNETAKAVADAMRKADEWATSEAKRLGKVFTPAEDWRIVQWWESSRVLKFSKAVLLADMEREIQAGGLKVFDPDTHEEANPLRMREILDGAVERIATDASLGGGPASGGGAFKSDMRVFRFADGEAGRDAYLRLMDKYGVGSGNYLSAMQTHYARIGRELGMMEVLGPGWKDVGEKLRQDSLLAARTIRSNQAMRTTAERLRDLPKDALKFAFSWLDSENRVNATWQHMSGQASGVGSELMAGIMAGARSYEVATKMGSAVLTAVPADTVNAMMAAKYLGMDQGRLLQKTFEAFLLDSPHLREEAERMGIAAHAGIDAAIGTKRFADQVLGEKVMTRMADFVIRAQGLHAWDNALRRVFIQELFGTIGQRAGVAYADLDKPFARFLDGYGFGAADWAEMSRPEHMLPTDNAKYLLPDNLPRELRIRLASAAYDQRQFAYLAGGSERVRSMGAGAKAGTFAGELGKSALMFKSFAMTLQATWGKRALNEAAQGRWGTLAALGIGMTMAGALAVQARSLVQGKDPRNMKDPWFWAEAALQGGALGYWGDFFHSAFSRSDTSLTESLMGPLATIPASLQSLTSGARRAAEDGEHVNFGAKLARIIADAPPGSNLWYTRLVKSRLIDDHIQRMIDPEWQKSFARQRQRAMKTTHQAYWWAPGQGAPGRGPYLEAMVQ